MRKSDKTLEKNIVVALTEACEEALEQYTGFQWLTHIVDYRAFPNSLTIICIFDTSEHLALVLSDNKGEVFKEAIVSSLVAIGLNIKDVKRRIIFDTEEACDFEHDGNWTKRFAGLKSARHV